MIKKVVISQSNKKAIAFLEHVSKSKEDFKRKLEENAAKRKDRDKKA